MSALFFRVAPVVAMILLVAAGAPEASAQSLASRLDDATRRIRDAAQTIEYRAARVSPAVLADALASRSAEGAALTVRDNFALDPYEGGLRGWRGTLFSGGGSSLDRTLLLGALLDELGIRWRVVQATADDDTVAALLGATTGAGSWGGPAIPVGTRSWSPTSDIRARGAVARHYWLQARSGSDWVDLDPTHPTLEPGERIAEPTQTWEPGVVPDDMRRVTVSLGFTDTRGSRNALVWTGSLADVGYRNLTLTISRSELGDRYMPVLNVMGEDVQGQGVPAEATRVWIEFAVERGGVEQRVARDLFHADSNFDFFHVDQQIHSAVVMPGFVGPDYYRAVLSAQLGQIADSLGGLRADIGRLDESATAVSTAQLGDAMTLTLSALAGITSLTYAHLSDTVTMRLAAAFGVRPFYDEARVVITSVHREGSAIGHRIDLRADDVAAFPYAGMPRVSAFAFQALRGRLNADLEAIVLEAVTGRSASALPALLAAARADGASYRTVHPGNVARLAETSYSVEARMRIADAVSNAGYAVVTISRPSDVDGAPILGWWLVDTVNGAVRSALEPDLMPGWTLLGSAEPVAATAPELASSLLELVQHFAGWASSSGGAADLGEPILCAALCDLTELADYSCGAGSGRSLGACLDTSSSASVDSLVATRSCSDLMAPLACGAASARAVLLGSVTVRPDGDVFAGPWGSVQPYSAAGCSCPD